MNIAIVGYINWYGSMAEWIFDGWEMNGHNVTKYDRKQLPNIPNTHDIYIFVDCSEDYSEKIPNINKPKIFWSMDSHMPGGIERSINIARKCDLVFSSNYEHGVKILEKFGIESFLLPVTYNPQLVDGKMDDEVDIVMIGHANSPERNELWELIESITDSYHVGPASEEEYIYAMTHAKIVINQPTEPWDMILNNRFFEALAGEALLLQKRLKTDLIEKLGFNEGVDFHYWDNFDDLQIKINAVLADYANHIPDTSYGKIEQYSMPNQCSKMETIILSKFYDRLP